MHKITNLKAFLKSEAVLLIAACAAVLSMFFIPPSADYINYIDFRTLALLFCLMATISGLRSVGLFDALARTILPHFKNARLLSLILMLLCFFSSMFITNDVALITFVPLTIIIFRASGLMDRLIYTVVLETAAANIGSTFTPVGNPQNLYLYSCYDINPLEFFQITLPVTMIGLLLLISATLLCQNQIIHMSYAKEAKVSDIKRLFCYISLFILCLCSVFYLVDFKILTILVCIIIFITDKRLFKSIDYGLLFTFVCFFVFVGNAERIDAVHNLLVSLIKSRELLSGVFLSQVISNVPAAILLSGFTNDYRALLLGTNIGGLGTLVASLASLISFKLYLKTEQAKPLRYLGVFTIVNIVFLISLLAFTMVFYI
jgi:Na+/H+ antiporter NhaD/arsenite permease-like protein